jgi:hypothetical protein
MGKPSGLVQVPGDGGPGRGALVDLRDFVGDLLNALGDGPAVFEFGRERKAKFYSLTSTRRAQLEKQAVNWNRLSAAIDLVVEAT